MSQSYIVAPIGATDIVSEALFSLCRDTYFSTLFGVCPTFRSRITAIILFFIF